MVKKILRAIQDETGEKISQAELAQRLGWSQQAVNMWATGKRTMNLIALSDVHKRLNFSWDVIGKWVDEEAAAKRRERSKAA